MRMRVAISLLLLLALVALPAAANEPGDDETTTVQEGEPAEPEEPELVHEEVTLYLHGTETVGELDIDLGTYRKMTRAEPTGDMPKSLQVVNYVAGPNTRCDGNFLLPTWESGLRGFVEGDVTVTLPVLAGPASQIVVELHQNAAIGCVTEGDVPVPVARQTVDLEPGLSEAEVVFEGLEFENRGLFNIMIHGNAGPTNQARILYDAEGYEARISFDCYHLPTRPSC